MHDSFKPGGDFLFTIPDSRRQQSNDCNFSALLITSVER
jgi:hypothetical protein